jgi:hypothetical protein
MQIAQFAQINILETASSPLKPRSGQRFSSKKSNLIDLSSLCAFWLLPGS